MWPHRQQPTRLPPSLGFSGKNTGVGCHFLLQCMKVKVKVKVKVAQSYPALSNPMNCSLPGSSVHGIFQARVLEWCAIAFSILYSRYLVQFSLVSQSCPILCDPMDCSIPGFSVHHQLPELAQIHVYWVGDAIKPSHPLSSPSPVFNLSQHQGLFKWISSSHQVVKVLELQLQHQSF